MEITKSLSEENIKIYCSPEGYENIPLNRFPKTIRAAYNYRLEILKIRGKEELNET